MVTQAANCLSIAAPRRPAFKLLHIPVAEGQRSDSCSTPSQLRQQIRHAGASLPLHDERSRPFCSSNLNTSNDALTGHIGASVLGLNRHLQICQNVLSSDDSDNASRADSFWVGPSKLWHGLAPVCPSRRQERCFTSHPEPGSPFLRTQWTSSS